LNANGIRSAARKGFFEWLRGQDADVVCIQETKAQLEQLSDDCFSPVGYHSYYEDAVKKGYSGVAIYTRHKPDRIIRGYGDAEFDTEGRYLEVRMGGLSVASVYLPSGSSSDERQQAKFRCLETFTEHLHKLRRRRSEVILCGDWNIAHKEIDLKNWKANQKNSGFTPEERAWMDQVFGEYRWVDAFRIVQPAAEQYTWWSNRGRARDNNVGWRIDYQVVTQGLRERVLAADIYKIERFSDHAPLIMDYDWSHSGCSRLHQERHPQSTHADLRLHGLYVRHAVVRPDTAGASLATNRRRRPGRDRFFYARADAVYLEIPLVAGNGSLHAAVSWAASWLDAGNAGRPRDLDCGDWFSGSRVFYLGCCLPGRDHGVFQRQPGYRA
jgi:exodeoxyribonuclease-3